jgi:subtilase family serine protease
LPGELTQDRLREDGTQPKPADLALERLFISPQQPGIDEDVTIRAIAVNHGSEPAANLLVLFLIDGQELSRETIPSLAAAERKEVSFSWRTTSAGNHALDIGMTPEAQPAEGDGKGSYLRRIIFVRGREEGVSDLSVAGLRCAPERPRPGDEVVLEGIIQNRGEVATRDVAVYWRIDDGREVQVKREQIDVLEAGERRAIESRCTAPVAGDELQISIVIDPENQVPDKDRSNNSLSFSFSTEPPETPPARVLGGDDFEQGLAGAWELSPNWQVKSVGGNRLISGEGAGIARLGRGRDWTDYAFQFRLQLLRGSTNVFFRDSEEGRYIIALAEEGVSLKKQTASEDVVSLSDSSTPISTEAWHDVRISGEQGQIRVLVDQALRIDYRDDSPLLRGGVALESKAGSKVHFDNTQTMASSAYPDLTLYCSGYSIPSLPGIAGIYPWPPLTDRPTIFSVTLMNAGLAPVERSCATEMYLDGNLVKTWPFPSPAETYDLGPNAKIVIAPQGTRLYDHQLSLAEGNHTLRWMADAQNTIKETTESNNQLVVNVACQKPPDLVVEDVWPTGAAYGGQTSIWNVRVKNVGQGDVKVPFLTTFWPEGITAGAQENVWTQSLAAGQSFTFQTTQSFHSWGELTVTVTVDVGNYVPEALPDGEDNNELVKKFDLAPVDLAVTNLTLSPANPTGCTPLTISFTVSNIGKGHALYPFKVKVMPGVVNNNLLQYALLTVNGLQSGQSVSLSHSIQLPAGSHTVSVEADCFAPDAVYWEPDRNNNTAVSQIQVQGPFSGLTNTLGPAGKLSMCLGESIFVALNNTADLSRDKDGDCLKDDLEDKLADGFRPYFKFDTDEKALGAGEPVTLFQVRPQGFVGSGDRSKTLLHIRWGFLYMWDGGYGPSSLCTDEHMGDNVPITYVFRSSDDGATWVLTSINLGGEDNFTWPGGYFKPAYLGDRVVIPYSAINVELYNQRHPVIYMSAHKHHMYFNTDYNHQDSFYSSWRCDEDVDGKGKAFISNLHSVFKTSRFNNVGEPESHPAAYFVNCMLQFPAGTIGRTVDPGNNECYNFDNKKGCYYSAWGTSHFYEETGNADLWLKPTECKFWK